MFMNGAVFSGLPALKLVSLEMNVCIGEKFASPYEIESLEQTIDYHCGLEEQADGKLNVKVISGAVYVLRNA